MNLSAQDIFFNMIREGIINVDPYDGVVYYRDRIISSNNSGKRIVVNISFNKIPYRLSLEKVVWMSIHGNLIGNECIIFKNGIKSDCRINNLEKITGTLYIHSKRSLDDKTVFKIKQMYKLGIKISELARYFNTNTRTIGNILDNRSYSNIGGKIDRIKKPKYISEEKVDQLKQCWRNHKTIVETIKEVGCCYRTVRRYFDLFNNKNNL